MIAIMASFMIAKRAIPRSSQIATQREKALWAESILPGVVRIAESAQRLRLALRIARALRERQRPSCSLRQAWPSPRAK